MIRRKQLATRMDEKELRRTTLRSVRKLILIYFLAVLILSGALSILLFQLLLFMGFLPAFLLSRLGMPTTMIMLVIFFACMISEFFSHSRFSPVDELILAMQQVADGDFTARVNEQDTSGQTRELVHSFNAMARELSSIEMFRKDFINNFSHEFKTPIVSIRGFAKQLEREDLTPEQRREYTAIIVSESERLANMSTNVLLLTRLENQQQITDLEEYDLSEQLRTCVLLLEKQWTEKDIELDLDDLNDTHYRGNPEIMQHVWVNLLGNAIKFSPQGGTLHVTCNRIGTDCVVSVRDHGEGMDDTTVKRVFEKFYQGDSAHTTEGNGLGLSLVKRIVDLCGGRIAVTSHPGEGSTFTVTLPDPPQEKGA